MFLLMQENMVKKHWLARQKLCYRSRLEHWIATNYITDKNSA